MAGEMAQQVKELAAKLGPTWSKETTDAIKLFFCPSHLQMDMRSHGCVHEDGNTHMHACTPTKTINEQTQARENFPLCFALGIS